jgi:ketosteroid isomerase-like protein
MDAARNKEILQEIFAATARGNTLPFVAALADDVVWTIIGTTAWSRSYDGKGAVLAELLAPLAEQMDGTMRITAQRFIAEGDLVVVEAQGHNATKAGKRYENTYCWIFRMADGRIAEIKEYADTQLFETALAPPGVLVAED